MPSRTGTGSETTPPTQWTVYIPRTAEGVIGRIASGSGMVGRPVSIESESVGAAGETIEVDFEGNLYQASNMKTWGDRVYHAAGRAATRYPTMARAQVLASALLAVGTLDTTDGVVTIDPEHAGAVARWLNVPELEASMCATSEGVTARRRELSAVLSQPTTSPDLRRYAQRELERLTGTHRGSSR